MLWLVQHDAYYYQVLGAGEVVVEVVVESRNQKQKKSTWWLWCQCGFELAMAMSCKDGSKYATDNGKYVRYTPEQVEALERLYHDCPKPSSVRRQQLIRECPILSHIEPRQIKVWFQNRRYLSITCPNRVLNATIQDSLINNNIFPFQQF